MKDILGARMKGYEREFTEFRIDPSKPVYARLDGRGFSKFTKGLERPFDARLSGIMQDTTEYLVKETKAARGYTQSDEISLMWPALEGETSEFLFDGKVQKLASILGSMCSVRFYTLYAERIGTPKSLPQFDCRILSMPEHEIRNMFVWRQIDASKNAISMAATHYLGHKRTMDMNSDQRVQMLLDEYGIDFSTYPEYFKRGTFIHRTNVLRELTAEELSVIPEKFRPIGPVERTAFIRSHSYE